MSEASNFLKVPLIFTVNLEKFLSKFDIWLNSFRYNNWILLCYWKIENVCLYLF